MKIVDKQTRVQSKYLNLYDTHYIDKNDALKSWMWVGRPNKVKAVVIIPIVEEEYYWNGAGYKQNNKVCVIKEFRVPINDYLWEFPAGLMDIENEKIETCIERELREETGLKLEYIYQLTPFTYNSPGITDEAVAMAFVKASGKLSKDHLEFSEEVEPFLFNQAEVINLLETEKNFEAKTRLILNYFSKTNHII
ncbi:MAG: NUDIX hydrolase [Candidatus Woesearchaeota archaeon]